MSSIELARKITHWAKAYHFIGDVRARKMGSNWVVEFEAKTTKTRASSMVTRVKLIAAEIVGDHEYSVAKELVGNPPRDRADIAMWRVFVTIPMRKRRLEAA